ncbi:NADH-quinone oxidoreductase subunit L, partial [Pseudomonas sp. MWU13-2860]
KLGEGERLKGVIAAKNGWNPAMEGLAHGFHGAVGMGLHAFITLPFLLALAGGVVAWYFDMKAPHIPAAIKEKCAPLHKLLENKYCLDEIYFAVFAKGSRALGTFFWKVGDMLLIDGLMVNGTAKLVGWFS